MGLCPRCQLKAYLLPVPGRVLSHFVLLSLLAGCSLMAQLGASQALSPVAQTQWFSFLPAGPGGAVRTQGWEKGEFLAHWAPPAMEARRPCVPRGSHARKGQVAGPQAARSFTGACRQ